MVSEDLDCPLIYCREHSVRHYKEEFGLLGSMVGRLLMPGDKTIHIVLYSLLDTEVFRGVGWAKGVAAVLHRA